MYEIFGLDFGTTNSALSVNSHGNVKMIDIERSNSTNSIGKTSKSVIYFDPEKKRFYVGQQAVDNYVKNDAVGRYIQSIKAFCPIKVSNIQRLEGKHIGLISSLQSYYGISGSKDSGISIKR